MAEQPQPLIDWGTVVLAGLRGMPGEYWVLLGGACLVLLATGLFLPGAGRARSRGGRR